MAEYNSILELLTDYKNSLHEAKEELTQRMETIDKDIRNCEVAINAITPIKGLENGAEPATTEPTPRHTDAQNTAEFKSYSTLIDPILTTERKPKKDDVLIATKTTVYVTENQKCSVIKTDDSFLYIENGNGEDCLIIYSYSEWREYFRFADETKPKLPYRIKTRQEMIDGGAVECEDGSIVPSIIVDRKTVDWAKGMDYLQGMELETNEEQFIPTKNHPIVSRWKIATWMITENK